MIQTINPNHADSRTAEILSRYRPIAPKPEPSTDNNSMACDDNNNPSNLPPSISKSPYLRTMWAQLQARPTRTRKRGRNAAFGPPPTTKRLRAHTSINTASSSSNGIVSYSCPYHHGLSNAYYSSPSNSFPMYGFSDHPLNNGISLVPVHCGLNGAVSTLTESVSVVPSVRYAEKSNEICPHGSLGLDLNLASSSANKNPQELDFMPRLIEPVKPTVISPKPVRPMGSTVTVKTRVTNDPGCEVCVFGAAEEVEKEAENEEIPVILSDSSNKVKLANAKYKEMIGQPECCWLDRCVVGVASSPLCKRIGGEVTLKLGEDDDGGDGVTLEMMKGFSCEVKIEWEMDGKKKCVEASCKAVKVVYREAKDYQFLWRFYDVCDLDVACKVSE